MKRFFYIVAVLVVILMLPSAISPQRQGIKPGNIAPKVVVGDTLLYNATTNGTGYTLLHFWASYDAPSRIANIQYNDVMELLDSDAIQYIAVSYEHSETLFSEIVKRDNVTTTSQYYDEAGRASRTYGRYRLHKGFATYLIDATGKIVAENPSPQDLTQLFGK
ncbi:MAG: redoxin domain-containing protein [Bacteroidales bacterium]|nr:redoxin domain-containing protein [Bacteroidales bacterium]